MAERREGPKEWDPRWGPRAAGTTMREVAELAKEKVTLPGRRWVVCWTEAIPIPPEDEEEATRVLNRFGVDNDPHTSEDLGYAAFVDHSHYFEEEEEGHAIRFYREVSKTAWMATLALSILDTEW